MAYELKDNSGSLFVNDRKTSEKQPAYKGRVKLLGKAYDLAVWTKSDRNGQTYYSFELSEPFKPDASKRGNQGGGGSADGDDIPF